MAHRQVLSSVILLGVILVVGTEIEGIGFIASTLPVSPWVANIWLTCNGILCVVAAICVYKNLRQFEERWTWQEIAMLRGVCWFLIAAAVGYLSRVVTSGGTISFGTPGTTLGVLTIIYASVGPPTRFEVADGLTRELLNGGEDGGTR